MAKQPTQFDEIGRLASLLLEDAITPEQCKRLEQMLLADPAAMDYYQRYVEIHSLLHWQYCPSDEKACEGGRSLEDSEEIAWDEPCEHATPWDFLGEASDGAAEPAAGKGVPGDIPPIVIEVSSPPPFLGRRPSFVDYFLQVGPFSYLVSAVLMCVAALGAWQYTVVGNPPFVHALRPIVRPSQFARPQWVAQVSNLDDIQWVETDPAEEDGQATRRPGISIASRLPLGRKVRIESGLLEITFDAGATVLLQGPAAFEIESNGGFLSVGRLTGRMERQAKPSDSQSSSAAPFAIRTPSAVVTDLGTEFGVEVDGNGRTTSHVFRGSVSVQPIGSSVQQGVVLHAGEAAFVETSSGRPSNIARVDGIPSRFVRRVPNGRISIPVFGTGIGSGAGQRDLHWRVVACSNDPAFEAQSAVVVGFPRQGWPVRDLQREQWISTHAVWNSPLPPGGTYTFRTDFELAPEAAKTARLTGFFYADKCIRAFRLNGRNVPVAQRDIKYEWEQGSGPSGEFSMDQGFVEGQNVLEIEVEAGEATETAPQMAAIGMKSALGLRVVLRGWALTP